MNARELQIENERLKKLLSKAQREREEERQQHETGNDAQDAVETADILGKHGVFPPFV